MDNSQIIDNDKYKIQFKNGMKSYIILDANKAEFDVYNTLNYIETYGRIQGDLQRDHAAKILLNALNKIKQTNNYIKKGIDGALELKYFGPTFYYLPYNDEDIIHNEQEKLIRRKLFENKKWKQLNDRIIYKKNKRNRKNERRRNKEWNEYKNDNNIDNINININNK